MGRKTCRRFLTLGLLGCLTAAHAASPVWAIHGDHNTVYLAGSVIDYQDGLTGAGFRITNPNAKQTCGCGKSFEA